LVTVLSKEQYVRISTLSFIAFVLAAGSAYGQTMNKEVLVPKQNLIEMQHLFDGAYHPTIDGLFTIKGDRGKEKSRLNLAVWFLVSDTWGEALFGPSVTFADGIGASVLVGIEDHDGAWRVNPNFWLFRGKFSTSHAFEWGASGFWYKSTATWSVHDRLALGVHSQRLYNDDGPFNGTGPHGQVKIVGGLSSWTSVLFGKNTQAITGVMYGF
jgi:hypothetical protein